METFSKYVVGIIGCTTQCLFISKQRPKWQAGRLNGVGGKVEDNEAPIETMKRECFEECGLFIKDWIFVGQLTDNKEYIVYYYYANILSLNGAYSKTDEQIIIVDILNLDYNLLVPPTDVFLRFCLSPFYKPLFLEVL